MPLPASLARRIVPLAAVLAAILTPALAAAGHIVTFTGEFEDGFSETNHFDGSDVVSDQLPPLFDLGRLAGGSFAASFLLRPSDLDDEAGSSTDYEYAPPLDLTFTLFDADGAAVHRGRAPISSASVTNDRLPRGGGGPGPRPRPKSDEVDFDASEVTDVTGLTLPPELYGPNRTVDSYLYQSFSSDFTSGSGPIDGLAIPLDGDTYLSFDDTGFFLELNVGNRASDGSGAFVDVYTELAYRITGATVVPVPEPASSVMLAVGLVGLAWYSGRRKAAGA